MDNNLTFLNACRNGQKSIAQIFLKKGGIDVNKRDAEGNTPLYYACLKGYRDPSCGGKKRQQGNH